MRSKTGFSILFSIMAILAVPIANGAEDGTDIFGLEEGISINDAQIINATEGGTNLSSGYPTRGFWDSNQVDVWVPFSFDFRPPENLDRAWIVMVVKPIGQLIGTDQLILKGSDGQGKVVYDNFNSLLANEWNTVEVNVSENSDVMLVIRTGHLEGVIQDDTAVKSVELHISSTDSSTGPWNDPSVRILIDEWLQQQGNCMKKVYPNAYIDSWGRICGQATTAFDDCTLTPYTPGNWDNYHYLWEKNLCPDYYPYTVQEYVSSREYLSFDNLAEECKDKEAECYR